MQLLKNPSINDQISSHRSQDKPHNFEQIEAYELNVSRRHDFTNLTNNFSTAKSRQSWPNGQGGGSKVICDAHRFYPISLIIIKITISSIVIGLKNSYFPLIHLPSCYRTVQQTNHIQSCSLNQPITFKVVV